MKRLLGLLLLLGGCGSEPAAPDGREQPAPAPMPVDPADLNLAGAAAPPGIDRARVAQALAAALPQPGSASLENLRAGRGEAICGEVAGGGLPGEPGARPFLITPTGLVEISPSRRIMFENPFDRFPDHYIQWCASPEELERIAPEIDKPLDPSALPDAPEPPPPEAVEEPAPKAASPPPPRPKSGDDSFSGAVIRPRD